jgi:tetratricopeptide (TPR) repeat protein
MTPIYSQARKITMLVADWSQLSQPQRSQGRYEAFLAEVERGLHDLQGVGGRLFDRQEAGFIALWSLEQVAAGEFLLPEQVAEGAVRFALNLRDAVRSLDGSFPLKLALATGYVREGVVPGEKAAQEFAMPFYSLESQADAVTGRNWLSGAAVELCCRLPAVVPDSGVAVDQATFDLIESTFVFLTLAQLSAAGYREMVAIFRVVYERRFFFRIVHPALDGLSNRLVGRDLEMKIIRDAYETATEDRENQMILLLGEAGVGKTRLLMEVERWRDLLPDSTRFFRAQASAELMQQPYGLLRRMFMVRFGIQENETEVAAFEKLLQGVETFLGPGHAEDASILAQLLGLPCADYASLSDTSSIALVEQRGLRGLAAFFNAVDANTRARGMIAIHLEDVQWADDKSLDTLTWLFKADPRCRLAVILTARPELLERRPDLGADLPNCMRIDLEPLSEREARKLVREMLCRVPDLPAGLRDWITGRCGGNPLYMQEVVKSLLAAGVIIREPAPEDESEPRWRVDLEKLEATGLPATLNELLQQQITHLPEEQRSVLRRASVFGHTFFDEAVAALGSAEERAQPPGAVLNELVKQKLIVHLKLSSFMNMQEYAFCSNLMAEETYLSISEAERRVYHRQAAEWLVNLSAESPGLMAVRIADHYEHGGEKIQAVPYLALASEEARRLNAFGEARQFLMRAVSYAGESPATDDVPGRAVLLYRLGEMLIWLGEASLAVRYLKESLDLARKANNTWVMAEVLGRLGWAAYYSGDFQQASLWLGEGVACSRQAVNFPALYLTLRQMGNVISAQGDYAHSIDYYQESLEIARLLGDQRGVALALNNLGWVAMLTGDFDQARRYLGETISNAAERSDRLSIALGMSNLGIVDYLSGEYELARNQLMQTIEISQEVGSQLVPSEAYIWAALCDIAGGDMEQARLDLLEALSISTETQQPPLVLGALVGFASLAAAQRKPERAVELLALTNENSALDETLRVLVAEPLLGRLHAEMTPQAFGLAWARGLALKQDEVVGQYLI